tara:strand:- start:764 stop:1006 length:243 start_codon:yes stop_codon:yes gene_type:complete
MNDRYIDEDTDLEDCSYDYYESQQEDLAGEAYHEGHEAAQKKEANQQNPHTIGCMEHRKWNEGYNNGRKQHELLSTNATS